MADLNTQRAGLVEEDPSKNLEMESHYSKASSISSSKLKKSLKNNHSIQKKETDSTKPKSANKVHDTKETPVTNFLAAHIKQSQKKRGSIKSKNSKASAISKVSKRSIMTNKTSKSMKLLKDGEDDYPSPFAKIWRKHMKEKMEDNPGLLKKKTVNAS